MLPEVDASLCNGCGVCSEFCAYNALAGLGRRILVFPELCHSCGGCALLCPQHAIREIPSPIGTIQSSAADGFELVSGSLTVGKAMSPPLIRAVKKNLDNDRVNIIDCPPGNSCPMTTAVRDADFVILVSEPTPFGLHDLKLAVDTVKELGLPHGIILNRSDSGDRGVHDFCRDSGIPLLLEIPESRHIAESYSRGIPMLRAEKNLEPQFKSLWNHIRILCSKELSS
jgi:MinD superfamily P-loop ATPase